LLKDKKNNIAAETYLQHLNNVMQSNITFCMHGCNHRGETVTSLRGEVAGFPPLRFFPIILFLDYESN